MSDDEYMRALEIQRRNFEMQFGSLEELGYQDKSRGKSEEKNQQESEEDSDAQISGNDFNEDESSDSDSETNKFSSEESDEKEEIGTVVPKVIKLTQDYSASTIPLVSKKDEKILRSGRVPTLLELEKKERNLSKMTKKQQHQALKEDDDNLENDLKLQRLLQESHILANSLEYSGADVTLQTLDFEAPIGKARKRTLDSRIRNIAAINSSTGGAPKTLEKMPMSMRKGMIRSRERRIAKYEEDARNAGIVLSKVKKGEVRELNAGKGSTLASDRLGIGKKKVQKVRDRGLKINSIGRSTRNGLIISQQEIDKVNGKNHGRKKRK